VHVYYSPPKRYRVKNTPDQHDKAKLNICIILVPQKYQAVPWLVRTAWMINILPHRTYWTLIVKNDDECQLERFNLLSIIMSGWAVLKSSTNLCPLIAIRPLSRADCLFYSTSLSRKYFNKGTKQT